MSESPSGKREGCQDNATRKREVYYWLEPGLLPHPTQSCRVREPRAQAVNPNLQGMHKRLVAGLSGLVTCLQSNFIGTNFCGLFFKLGRSRAFQLSLCFSLGAYWLAGSRRPDGRESYHFRGNWNLGPGCLLALAASQTLTLKLEKKIETSKVAHPWRTVCKH